MANDCVPQIKLVDFFVFKLDAYNVSTFRESSVMGGNHIDLSNKVGRVKRTNRIYVFVCTRKG